MAIKPIVVGADGSDRSLRAVDWATREAVLRDVPLRIVSVCALEPRVNWFTQPDPVCGAIRETAEKALQDAGDRADASVRGLTTDTCLLVGQPAPVLVDTARNAAMLVIGARLRVRGGVAPGSSPPRPISWCWAGTAAAPPSRVRRSDR